MVTPSQLTLSRADLVSGRMPDVCALTGRPTDWREPVRFGAIDTNLETLVAFILFGWVALFWAPRRIEGRLPVSREARRRRTPFLLLGRLLVPAGFVLLIIGIATPDAVIAAGGVVATATGIALLRVAAKRWVRGKTFRALGGEYWVLLHNLHPAFIAAYQAQYPHPGTTPEPGAAAADGGRAEASA